MKTLLRVGSRGEIYTTKELREKVGIKRNSRVKAIVEDGRLIIEPVPTIEEMIRSRIIELTPSEAEELSVKAQREAGLYG